MPEQTSSDGGSTAVAPAKPRPKATPKKKPGRLPPYNVVLLDDNDHTYEYVVEMLKVLFAYPEEKGFLLADAVNITGRVIVFTGHKEMAELKCEQIHSYGTDTRVATCKGSMSAYIEPAEE